MIEFTHVGEHRFANVFEYGESQQFYHIHLINTHSHPGGKIILQKSADGIRVTESPIEIQPDLLHAIINSIEAHLASHLN